MYKELIVKKGDSFIITDVLDVKMGIEVLFQELQRRSL
jgi:hypothetical protein